MGNTKYHWRLYSSLEISSDNQLRQLINKFAETHHESSIDHHFEWLALRLNNNKDLRLYISTDPSGNIIGYAPLFGHPGALTIELLGHALFSYRTYTYVLTQGPLLNPEHPESDDLVAALLKKIMADLSGSELLIVVGMDLDSPVAHRLSKKSDPIIIAPRGPMYERRLITLPNTFDGYMKSLGSKTRQDLRRQKRRLYAQVNDKVAYRAFTSTDDIPIFLSDAEHISKKTYQWHMLEMGVKNTGEREALLNFSANKNWFRSYVMYCNEVPVAFMLGYSYNGNYESVEIGFDPSWSEYSVGNILHMHVVEDLINLNANIKTFDFMYGDNQNKKRLSTHSRNERNYFLAPATLRWKIMLRFVTAGNRLIEKAGGIAEKYQIKSKIRRYLKRKSVAHA